MITKDDRDRWTEQALEALKQRPEANSDLPTTETAAWRAGYVAAWIDLCSRVAESVRALRTGSSIEPSER